LDTRGRHLLVEYHGCDPAALNDVTAVERLARAAAEAAGARIVAATFHPFQPHGVSGVVVVEESHLAIHTWPESGYAAVDFYTCGAAALDAARQVLGDGLRARRTEWLIVERGAAQPGALRVTGPENGAIPRGFPRPT